MSQEGEQSLLGRLLCLLDSHDYRWTVTTIDPKLNWQECTRCSHVEPEFRHHYERYHDSKVGENGADGQ